MMPIKSWEFEENHLKQYGPSWAQYGLLYRRFFDPSDEESYSRILLITNPLPISGIEPRYSEAKRIAEENGVVLTTYDFSKERSETDEKYVFLQECNTFTAEELKSATDRLIRSIIALKNILS